MGVRKPKDTLLCAGIIVYNDAPGLDRCLNSIYQHVNRVFVIDGRYPEYGNPDMPKFSTDDPESVCKKYGSHIEYHQLFAPQVQKRNRYLDLAMNYSFLLVIDCDEFIINKGRYAADWVTFLDMLSGSPRFDNALRVRERDRQYVHNIQVLIEPERITYLGKLFYRPYELYYVDHWVLHVKYNGKRQMYPNMGDRKKTVFGITLTTDEEMRPESRLRDDVEYQWNLTYREGYKTKKEHDDPREKLKFIEHNIHEMQIWKKNPNSR